MQRCCFGIENVFATEIPNLAREIISILAQPNFILSGAISLSIDVVYTNHTGLHVHIFYFSVLFMEFLKAEL